MKAYLDIAQDILATGTMKGNRTGIRTLTKANIVFSHDMSEGFPLLTTKKMPIKSLSVELEGFIKGITSKRWYQDRGCTFWNEWANGKTVQKEWKNYDNNDNLTYIPSKKSVQRQCDDLGPIYGYQWRKFGEVYDEDDNGPINGYDQLKEIVNTLHTNPDDRRMVCSAWNPHQLNTMALPPCHFCWGLVHIDGKLNLYWTQRSCDYVRGVPVNIASYALLLCLLCKEANMIPGNLTGLLADCHIYENQIDGIKKQLEREPREIPILKIWDQIDWNIFNWDHKNITIENYHPYLEKIDFGEIAV